MICKIINLHSVNSITPEFDIYIGRKVNNIDWTFNSKWGNYYETLNKYEDYIRNNLWNNLDELINKRLGCWCITTIDIHPIICHGQVLMKLLYEKLNLNYCKLL